MAPAAAVTLSCSLCGYGARNACVPCQQRERNQIAFGATQVLSLLPTRISQSHVLETPTQVEPKSLPRAAERARGSRARLGRHAARGRGAQARARGRWAERGRAKGRQAVRGARGP